MDRLVRLYAMRGEERWFVDVPYSQRFNEQAKLEMTGATIYHATIIKETKKNPGALMRGFLGLPGDRVRRGLKWP